LLIRYHPLKAREARGCTQNAAKLQFVRCRNRRAKEPSAMVDVYDLCPCGSGKKLKFCCAGIIDEMTKINRLQANDQPRQALAAIEKIEKSNPDNPWVGTVHAEILLSLGQVDEAQSRLDHLLKHHPDHPYVVARAALVLLLNQGYRAAQPTILRAFQKCFTRAPE
jgi:predicted Zn-dependent protease